MQIDFIDIFRIVSGCELLSFALKFGVSAARFRPWPPELLAIELMTQRELALRGEASATKSRSKYDGVVPCQHDADALRARERRNLPAAAVC